VRCVGTAGRGMHLRRGGPFKEVAVDPSYGVICERQKEDEAKDNVRAFRVAH
jgi:hypothetical protein